MQRYGVLTFYILLGTLCKTFGSIEKDDTLVRNETEMLPRIQQLENFLLPLPADQMHHLLNETVMRYVPVNSLSQTCREHSLLVLESFNQRHLWALRMLDAGTKLQSGVLDGHLEDLGNFEQCINIVHLNQLFKGQHCVIRTLGLLNENIQLDKLYPTDITFSLCVPSSCSVEDVAAHVDSVLAQVNATTVYSFVKNSGVEVGSLDKFLTCSEQSQSTFRLEDYVALITFITTASVTVIFSMCESLFGLKSVLSGLSLRNTFKGLMDTRKPPHEISCLNGLRVIFILSMIGYHRLFGLLLAMPSYRRKHVTEEYASLLVRLFETATITLDGFFMMGGIVTSYTFFLKRDKQLKTNTLKSYVSRYFRLTPVLAVVILFYTTLAVHVSSGPLWPQMREGVETVCREHWWVGLLHISNYYCSTITCVGQSWYVACDFQLYLLSPLILIPLHKRPKLGMTLILVCVLGPITYTTVKSYREQLYPGSTYNSYEMQRQNADSSLVDYRGFHLRMLYYVVGMALGYILFTIKHNKRKFAPPTRFFTLGWTVAGLVLTTYTLVSLIIFHPDHIFNPWFDPLYNGLAKPLACAVVAWVIFACSLGHGGFIDSFLSWSAFRPLARLVFSVYLVHEIVMIIHTFSVQVPLAFSVMDYIYLVCGDTIISFTLAILLYLTVEIPCSQLANQLLADKKPISISRQSTQPISSPISDQKVT